MAWTAIIIGTLTGLLSAVLSYVALALPLWLCLLIYPAVGTLTALILIAALILWHAAVPANRPLGDRAPV